MGQTQPSQTVIVERNPAGHRLYYVKLIALAALGRGDAVSIVLQTSSKTSAEFSLHLGSLPIAISTVFLDKIDLSEITRFSKQVGADLTIIPDGDRVALKVGVTGWAGCGVLVLLVMRRSAQPSRILGMQKMKSTARTALFRKASKVRRVKLAVLESATWTGDSKFLVATDPVTLDATPDDVESIRDAWTLSPGKYWFSVLGAISSRKNVSLVLQSLQGLPPSEVGFLLAGKCEPGLLGSLEDLLAQLKSAGFQVVVVDRLLDDHELDAAVRAIDCIVLAHSNEGPSGLFGKAIMAGTRIVAAGAVSLQRDCVASPAGSIWVPLGVSQLRTALKGAYSAEAPNPRPELGSTGFTDVLLGLDSSH